MKQIKILVIPSDYVGGVGEFRSIKPHLYLGNNYPEEFRVDIAQPNLSFTDYSIFDQYDIIHYHKYLETYEKTNEHVDELTARGKVTIMDIDDYWLPDMRHPSHKRTVLSKTDKKIISNLKHAKNIITTTEIFKAEISKINKNVVVIENGVDTNETQFISNPVKSNKVRFGWLGGSTHKEDLLLLAENVNKLMSSPLKSKVQLVLCGFDTRGSVRDINPITNEIYERPFQPTETTWYEYEKIFTNNYSTISKEYKEHLLRFTKEEFPGVENEPYRRVWTKQITSYANNYNLFDVALAPLVESKFNACKSQLKAIECGVHKKALIAQNFGPYQIDLKNSFSKGGFYDETANALLVDKSGNKGDWFKYMKKLVEDPKLRESLATNLHNEIVNKYSLKVLSNKRKDLYKKLVKDLN